MDELLKTQLAEAETQLAFWREQEVYASRQVVLWQGAVEGLKRLQEAAEAAGEGEEEQGYARDVGRHD